MKVGSLFSGIGGLDLGLERAGMTVVWQSEIDPYASKVLAKHWPTVPNLGDITTIDWSGVEPVDLICGGFPCQDISNAGRRVGIGGIKSGLWKSMALAVRVLRPRYVLVENVAALLVRGIDVVLADLAALGFDADWSVLSACRMGAPHTRERVFLLAYPNDERHEASGQQGVRDDQAMAGRGISAEHVHEASQSGRSPLGAHWSIEPDVDRLADGLSGDVDRRRLFALGNAVVPQVAEYVGRRIMAVAA